MNNLACEGTDYFEIPEKLLCSAGLSLKINNKSMPKWLIWRLFMLREAHADHGATGPKARQYEKDDLLRRNQ